MSNNRSFSFMNVKAVRYQVEYERMLLSDYYVYFYDKDIDCVFNNVTPV